uniref:MORN repeat-containing protein 1 n=1 Tax=Trichobilharzia regenti TaxID=157069 RepID=A0AA85JGA7_TRIRE|nr:unnamed protein product [Trichobilharzia regenti]
MSTGFYVGQTHNDKRNGTGIYSYRNGYYKYEGQWSDGKKCGNGKFTMKDGSVYEGDFTDGEISGKGRRYYPLSKNEYIGHFMLGERHGYGRMNYGNGCVYEGDWLHNSKHDGSKYTGGFIENKRSGAGCLWTTMFVYWGYWKNNIFNGTGTLKLINGTKYEGEFVNGKPSGHGKLTRQTILMMPSYEGLWKDGSPCQTAQYMRLSVEAEKAMSDKNYSSLLEYQNSPVKEAENYKFATLSWMEISTDELKTNCSVDICVYTENRQILIEESNRQLALWVGKICKEKLQCRIPVKLQFPVSTPLLSSMERNNTYTVETPFGFSVFPIGSVSLVSSCNNEEKVQREDVLSSLKPEADTVNRVCDNLHLDAEEIKLKVKDIVPESDAMMNENQYLLNEIFVYRQATNRGFVSYSVTKSTMNADSPSHLSPVEQESCATTTVKTGLDVSTQNDSIDLSVFEKSILLFEEFANSPRIGDQFVFVVEDITPQEEKGDDEGMLCEVNAIPCHILRSPKRLSPLFIKLHYNTDLNHSQ